MTKAVLVLNAGSSSLKFSVYDAEGGLTLKAKGQIEGIGTAPHFVAKSDQGETLAEKRWEVSAVADHKACLNELSIWLADYLDGKPLTAVGHRVVHGGPDFAEPVAITPDILSKLETFTPLAPLHQPHNLAGIHAVMAVHPGIANVACFDTAFHRGHDWVTEAYALPYKMYEEGVRRYGFHGSSYEYIARSLTDIAPDIANKKVIVAHLGSGASICAIEGARSVASTMGFTAVDGLPMGTRTGQLDPGVVLYLMQQKGFDAKQIETLLYKESGLKGISGVSNDLRALMESTEPRAKLAVDYFVYRIGREIGSLAAALQGIDALVFTAGIGEHAPDIRKRVCDNASWLGIDLDSAANESGQTLISKVGSKVQALVIPTDEELMIATHTLEVLGD